MAQVAQVNTDRNTNKRSVNKCRNWCFTLNNYTPEDIDTLTQSKFQYIFQEEKGENGTAHLQGLLCSNNAVSFNSIKKLIPKAHIEACKNKNASINYCKKGETRCGMVYTNVESWTNGNGYVRQKYPWEMDEKEWGELIDLNLFKEDLGKGLYYDVFKYMDINKGAEAPSSLRPPSLLRG